MAYLDGAHRRDTVVGYETFDGQGVACVRYKGIPVFRFWTDYDDKSATYHVVLNTGGVDAPMIRDRMNQSFRHYGLPISVVKAGDNLRILLVDKARHPIDDIGTASLYSKVNVLVKPITATIDHDGNATPIKVGGEVLADPVVKEIDEKTMRRADHFLRELEKELGLE